MFEAAAFSLPLEGRLAQGAGWGGFPLRLAALGTSPFKGEENHGFEEAPWTQG
ncbi:MAG: hypothetical protein Rhirs2KO_18900 [Rhizobiaceae bacterium]